MLRAENITKLFGTLKANDSVSLEIGQSEIHALLGENGAGKSTLVKMIYGALQPSEGQFYWDGRPVVIRSPSEARALGIGMVFQHFSLFDSLSVADNIELSLDRMMDRRTIKQQTLELSEKYGLPLNPDAIIGDLSVGERQRVEIIRCLLQNPELIILDEPTSVLTPAEAENLFDTLRRLKAEGRSILYISHRLDEVIALCDRATILRHGRVVEECDPKTVSARELASLMVGGDIADVGRKEVLPRDGAALLEVNGVSLPARTPFATNLKDINLSVRAGEVVAIAGVAGNGQNELFDLLSGEATVNIHDGIKLRGTACGRDGINARRLLGAAFVPEERLGHAAVGALRLSENMLLARHASDAVGFLKFGAAKYIWKEMLARATKRVSDAMDVRKSGDDPFASSLSGGNLQKFVMGRELDRQPSVMVVNQPTWGVDAGAAANIRQALIDLAASGAAVVVISQDLDEVFEISDRIAVMHDGQLSQPVATHTTDRDAVGLLMAGMGNTSETEKSAGEHHAH